ncbi:MAG: hypothetical protein SP1CHLAM54_06780 [Chlamydiia bacterium]|nr:hypothetical protein [Chlamydiia bacterium]MCH9615586.1 hypothetical protein [Chlamydiia bacterium]MCH9629241.1 hypothetical protein [Chlamydiia bacterium]
MKYFFPIIALVLGGCATSYHQKGFFGDGYSDYRVTEKTFAVTFRGNKYTDQENVRRFALMRAAELATTHGFRYFKVTKEKEISSKYIEKESDEYEGTLRVEEVISPGIEMQITCSHEALDEEFIDAVTFLSYNPKK